jgi:hypothetical protein
VRLSRSHCTIVFRRVARLENPSTRLHFSRMTRSSTSDEVGGGDTEVRRKGLHQVLPAILSSLINKAELGDARVEGERKVTPRRRRKWEPNRNTKSLEFVRPPAVGKDQKCDDVTATQKHHADTWFFPTKLTRTMTETMILVRRLTWFLLSPSYPSWSWST